MYALVCYDVPAARTVKYHKLLGQYLSGVQESVFAGDLSEVQWKKLIRAIDQLFETGDNIITVTTANRYNVIVKQLTESGQWRLRTDHQGSDVI